MSGRVKIGWPAAVGAILLLAAVVGYLTGTGTAVGTGEADRARDGAFRQAQARAAENARAAAAGRGYRAGLKRGRAAGIRVGAREGMDLGGGETILQVAATELAGARARAAAARAAISARQANCGVVASAPEWCPTADELTAWRAAVRAAREAEKPDRDGKPGDHHAGD